MNTPHAMPIIRRHNVCTSIASAEKWAAKYSPISVTIDTHIYTQWMRAYAAILVSVLSLTQRSIVRHEEEWG